MADPDTSAIPDAPGPISPEDIERLLYSIRPSATPAEGRQAFARAIESEVTRRWLEYMRGKMATLHEYTATVFFDRDDLQREVAALKAEIAGNAPLRLASPYERVDLRDALKIDAERYRALIELCFDGEPFYPGYVICVIRRTGAEPYSPTPLGALEAELDAYIEANR
jgi:hypothetical protein